MRWKTFTLLHRKFTQDNTTKFYQNWPGFIEDTTKNTLCFFSVHSVVLLTNMKLLTGLQWVPKSVTLSNLEQPNGRHITLFHTIEQLSEPAVQNSLQLEPCCHGQKCTTGSLVFDSM